MILYEDMEPIVQVVLHRYA